MVGLIAFLASLQKPHVQNSASTQSKQEEEKIQIALDPENPPKIPIMEYHNFGDSDERWTRSYIGFYNDLLWLYNNDFRVVTVAEFIDMDFSRLKPGTKPVLLTFDDSSKTQFRMLEDGSVDPECAVGVLDKFVKDYPDFGPQATFFVLPGGFGQAEFFKAKIEYLKNTGREVASHTYGHENLDEITPEEITKTLQDAEEYIGFELTSLAYPNGLYPDTDEGIAAVANEVKAAFLVGASPSRLPDDPNFNPMKIRRIQAIEEEWVRHFGRGEGEILKQEKELKFNAYIAGAEYIEKKVYPYETCKPVDYQGTPVAQVVWKWLEYKAGKVAFNKPPKELKLKGKKYYYTITGEEESSISELFFDYSGHYRVRDFQNAIIAANPDSNFLAGDEVLIPDIPLLLFKHRAPLKNPWGIYLTAYSATSDQGPVLIKQMQERGGGLIVFDVKEIDGHVYFETDSVIAHETGAQEHILYHNLSNYVRYWHDRGVYLVARIVIFKDINLAKNRPDLAIQSVNGGPWSNREGVVWVDPSNIETQNYILELVEDLAEAGIDEIQFDYIRFPTLGPVNETKYNFDEDTVEKYEVIRNFIARVHDLLRPYESKLSMDVYGVIVWNNEYDSRSTGQKMACLGPYIDVVYPMVYPSHFGPGFAGFSNPGDEPYYFVAESLKLFNKYLEGTNTEVRPWLQAFAWHVTNYGGWYVDEQVKATNDLGWRGYALWNAGNNYFN